MKTSKSLLLILLLSCAVPMGAQAGKRADCCQTACETSCCEDSCDNDCLRSRSVLIPRQITYDSTYELALANYNIYHHDDDSCFRVWKTPLYQRSRDNKDRLQRYFLPNRDCNINVQQDGTGNVGSPWLDLQAAGNDYASVVTISPIRQVVGVHYNAHLDLSHWWCGAWLGFATAPLFARNELRPCETNCVPAECNVPGIDSVIAALNNPRWDYGKLGDCKKNRWHFGIDDVQIKWGKDWFFCDDQHHVGIYTVTGIPTGNHPSAEHLFSTSVGSSHGRWGAGVNADFGVYSCNDTTINLMLDFKYFYVFRGKERRSFDLCDNGDWSRYLQVVFEGRQGSPLPAINYLTLPVNVTPRSIVQLWVAPHLHWCNWDFEVGYNLWWRQAERLRLDCSCFPDNLGIFDISASSNFTSASTANISQTREAFGANFAVSDAEFTPIEFSDIDVNSGRQGRALTHKVYAAADKSMCICNRDLHVGVGGSYEFARRCEYPLENWAVFLKLGHAF